MILNFKGILKTASLCALPFMLSGCITWGLVSLTGSGPSTQEWQSDTITGLSLAEDSNGTKGYVFVGKSLDYLLTKGGDDVVKMLNDPAIHGEKVTASNNAKFILSTSNKNFSGALTLYYDWNNEEDKALATQYGFACESQRCTWLLDGLRGSIHEKNKNMDYSKVMVFHRPFKVGFYKYKSSGGISHGVANALLPVTVTLDVVTSPLQFLILCTAAKC